MRPDIKQTKALSSDEREALIAALQARADSFFFLLFLFALTPRTDGASWCNMVYSGIMPIADKSVRQSVSLPARVARRVKSLAQTNKTSANRVIVALIESGLDAREREKERFFALADHLADSRDPRERKRLKEELARMTFSD